MRLCPANSCLIAECMRLHLALLVQAILTLVLDSNGNNILAAICILQCCKSGSRGEVGMDTRRSYKVSAPVEPW